MATLQEQLTEVQAAISKVLLSQSYSIGGRQLARASLAELQVREAMLKKEIASASRRGMITVVGVRPIEQ